MTASHTHLSHHLLVLLLICRHVNTNLLVLENTTAITEPPVETPGPKSSPLAPHTPMQTGQNRQSVVLTETPGPKTSPLAPLTPLQTRQKSVVLTGENLTEKVEVVDPVTLNLECAWTGTNVKLSNITGHWAKDGETIENSYSDIQPLNGRYFLRREFSIMGEGNLGTYSCIFGPKARVDFILQAPYLGEVRDKPIVSYAGDSVVMICKMDEKKSRPLSWNWYRHNGTDKAIIDVNSAGHRYKISLDEKKTKLLVHNLTESDSGVYYCGAVYGVGTSMGHMTLRVITYYEPLKPFIVIVVEVLLLVVVILLYEKTGSKKQPQSGDEGNNYQPTIPSHEENAEVDGGATTRQRKV